MSLAIGILIGVLVALMISYVIDEVIEEETNKRLIKEKQKVKELLHIVIKYKEYFSAIESGEYSNNRRPAPLRDYENDLQFRAKALIKEHGECVSHKTIDEIA